MPYTILHRYKDEQRVAEVDKQCKVKFNFQWMDDKVIYEDNLGVQKTILAGSFLSPFKNPFQNPSKNPFKNPSQDPSHNPSHNPSSSAFQNPLPSSTGFF